MTALRSQVRMRLRNHDRFYFAWCRVETAMCRLRGPHEFTPLFANSNRLLVCRKCSKFTMP